LARPDGRAWQQSGQSEEEVLAGMTRRTQKLSHIDADNHPRMVDVGAKAITARAATAQALVRFPAAVARALRENGMRAKKGPLIDTAIIAGTLAVKRTHELIPFCHPLAVERCDFTVEFSTPTQLSICCEVIVFSLEPVSVCRVSADAVTVTISVGWPTSIEISRPLVSLVSMAKSVCVFVLNPGASVLIV